MNDATWVITTFVFLFTTVLFGLLCAAFWTFMRDEGRFFFLKNFDKRGIDVIRHEPLSNRLRLISVRWNGQWFQHGKEMILFGIEPLIDPKTEPQRYFNEVISKMCTWADSKRPVLIATDIMSHMITPELAALVARSKKHEKYAEAKGRLGEIRDRLNALRGKTPTDPDENDPEFVTYLETIKPDDLANFMEDVGARDAYQIYETGKRVSELERSKGMEFGTAAKVAISLAGIGMVLIVIYLAATGQLQEIFQTVTN